MKALIVEIGEKYAAALLSDGNIIKVPKGNYSVGQEVNVSVSKKPRKSGLIAAAACFLLFVTGGAGYASTITPYSYVTLDVNPSIEYTLNRYDQVVSIDCVNDEGQEIIDAVSEDMTSKVSFEDAFRMTVDALYDLGYLTGEEQDYMVLSVCCDKSSKKAQALETDLSVLTADYNGITSEVVAVTQNDRQAATELHTTAGKLALILDVVSQNDNLTEDNVKDFVDKSVKQIVATIDSYKENPASAEKPDEVTETPSSGSEPPRSTTIGKTTENGNSSNTDRPEKPESEKPVIVPEEPEKLPSDTDDIDDSDLSGPGR